MGIDKLVVARCRPERKVKHDAYPKHVARFHKSLEFELHIRIPQQGIVQAFVKRVKIPDGIRAAQAAFFISSAVFENREQIQDIRSEFFDKRQKRQAF